MVITHHVVIGVAQVQGKLRGGDLGYRLRARQAGPTQGVVHEGDAGQTRVGGKGPVQPVAQLPTEKLPVVIDAEGEPLRVTGDTDVGPVAVKDQVLRIGQLLAQHRHFRHIIRFIGRELPDVIRVQFGYELIPVIIADYGSAARQVIVYPLGRRYRRMGISVNLLKSQRIKGGGDHHQRQRRPRQRRQKLTSLRAVPQVTPGPLNP